MALKIYIEGKASLYNRPLKNNFEFRIKNFEFSCNLLKNLVPYVIHTDEHTNAYTFSVKKEIIYHYDKATYLKENEK